MNWVVMLWFVVCGVIGFGVVLLIVVLLLLIYIISRIVEILFDIDVMLISDGIGMVFDLVLLVIEYIVVN